MAESEFIKISSVFTSLDIIEKGIEKIYYYLLKNKKIENLKDICSQFGLTLKRGYKICSVLNDLELVQIYDRPMKVLLNTPLVPAWQKIVNDRIEMLHTEFQEKKEICEASLQDFLSSYDLIEPEPQQPVQFINFEMGPLNQIYYPFFARSYCKIAIGIKYNNPIANMIQKATEKKTEITLLKDVPNTLRTTIKEGINTFKDNLKKISIKAIFNAELLDTLLQSKEYMALSLLLDTIDLEFSDLEVKISDDYFSNFSLVSGEELLQPSFSPTHDLIGIYISRNNNIFQIFDNKFNELFESAMTINEYLKKNKQETLDAKQIFALCMF